jgi:hypothetical protein
LYHLVYEDWNASVGSQGAALGTDLVRAVGFEDVERVDGRFFQPVLVGTRP